MTARVTFFVAAAILHGSADPARAALPYPIVDTGQTACYDNHAVITPPRAGQPFCGQDAQFVGHPASYARSADGLTVEDRVTKLTWQRSPDVDGDGVLTQRDKLTWAQAQERPAQLNAARFGGYDDWRLPGIKEQYSLFDARGIDPSGPTDAGTSRLKPYLDTTFFQFAYGDATGERVIDSQYASSTRYVANGPRGSDKVFGVNFADGRIKGYDLQLPGSRREKTFFVLCVRGNPAYGRNVFHDNGDGTVTDRATDLTWARDDSGRGMNWQEALSWVEAQNAARFLGHADWRLPSVKELQSLVDYTRCPDTSRSPAIDPVFACSAITNEAGQLDFPFYWSATTHAGLRGGTAAMYVAFGRAAGWLSPRPAAGGPREVRRRPDPADAPEREPSERRGAGFRYVDVHGAGSQRSDPKSGDPALFPRGRGPQGDVVRIRNYARLVRGGEVRWRAEPPAATSVRR